MFTACPTGKWRYLEDEITFFNNGSIALLYDRIEPGRKGWKIILMFSGTNHNSGLMEWTFKREQEEKALAFFNHLRKSFDRAENFKMWINQKQITKGHHHP